MSSSLNVCKKEDKPKDEMILEIRNWMMNQMKWKGRIDDEFITIFLDSCDFEVELTKKTFSIYYGNRRKIPQWWANRNLDDPLMLSVLQKPLVTILVQSDNPGFPTLIISKISRIDADSELFDAHFKLFTLVAEILIRRPNCKLNGCMWIFDFRDYSWKIMLRCFSPFFLAHFLSSFYSGLPVKIKTVVMLNPPGFLLTLMKLGQAFSTQPLNDVTHLLDYDQSLLTQLIPKELLPEEYGGEAGPMSELEGAFLNELLSHSSLVSEDKDYGFH